MFQKLKKQGGELRFGSALIAKEVLQVGTLLSVSVFIREKYASGINVRPFMEHAEDQQKY